MSSDPDQPTDNASLIARAFAGFGPAYFKWVQSRFAKGGVSFARMRLLDFGFQGLDCLLVEVCVVR